MEKEHRILDPVLDKFRSFFFRWIKLMCRENYSQYQVWFDFRLFFSPRLIAVFVVCLPTALNLKSYLRLRSMYIIRASLRHKGSAMYAPHRYHVLLPCALLY